MEQKLTEGSVLKNIARFSFPFFIAYFLQTLYGLADLYIIGRFEGTDQITAVSIGSQVMHMLTVMIVGLAMGATVMIGRAIGAGQKEQAEKNIGNTITLFTGLALLLTVILLIAVKGIVTVVSTPEAAVDGTTAYLKICFLGIPFIVAYNIISSVFRGLGDSKSPMYFVIAACITNVALDFLFIGALGMKAAGAALGTVLSQTVSVVTALIYIKKRKTDLKVSRACLRPSGEIMKPILKVGVPVSMQDGFIQISFILITIIANRRGLNDAAAVGIVEKIIGFVFLVPSTMLSTVSALAAQNIGAGKWERADKTLRYAVLISIGYGLLIGLAVQFIAHPLVRSFDKNPAVVTAGGQYIRGYIWDALFAGIHFSFSGYFCALGRSGFSFLHNAAAIVLVRIPGAYLMSKMFADTLMPMGLAVTCGSLFSTVICAFLLLLLRKTGKDAKGACHFSQ